MAKILVVDDKEMMRDSVATILGRRGHTVATAPGGEAALERIAEKRPDAVITDLQMPGMSGLAFVETYHQRGGAAPILFVDGSTDHDKVMAAIKAGVASFVLKPVDQDTFAQHVLKTLAKRKSA